jgi:hypothetical protein
MKPANATNLDRKSGVAQRRDLRFALMEKRNLAIRPRHIRFCRKWNRRSPFDFAQGWLSASLGMTRGGERFREELASG